MDQLSFEIADSICSEEEQIKSALASELHNPEYSRFLSVNRLSDGKISVKAKSFLVTRIKLDGKTRYFEIPAKYTNIIPAVFSDSSYGMKRASIESLEGFLALSKQISIIYMAMLSDLGGEGFGCCSRYEQCSDALQCINPDIMLAQACAYRKHLEAGKVFYGKNKNI